MAGDNTGDLVSTTHQPEQPYIEAPFDRIPDEILEWIIKSTAPPPPALRDNLVVRNRQKWPWHACALVSRRWYNITIPSLFCHIYLSPASPGDMSDFYSFISCKPSIARHIHGLVVRDLELQILALAETLNILRSLKILCLSPIAIRSDTGDQRIRRSFNIGSLYYGAPFDVTNILMAPIDPPSYEYERTTFALMGLFSKIDYFTLRGRDVIVPRSHVENEEEQDSEGEQGPEQSLLDDGPLPTVKFHFADLGPLSARETRFVAALNKLHGFRNLTGLRVGLGAVPRHMENLDAQLCLHGSALRSLALEFKLGLREDFEIPSDIQVFAVHIQKGLSACVALRSFSITLHNESRVGHWELPTVLASHVDDLTPQGWRFALELLSFLPEADQLDELILIYHLNEVIPPNLQHEFEGLPWPKMRDTCRRFTQITSISLQFSYQYDEEDEDEMGRHAACQMEWKKWVIREMKEFEAKLVFDKPQ